MKIKKNNENNDHLNDIFMHTPISSANESTGSGDFYKSTLVSEKVKRRKKKK